MRTPDVDAQATGKNDQSLASHSERMLLALEAGNTGVWTWNPLTLHFNWDQRIAAIWGLPTDRDTAFADVLQSVHSDDIGAVNNALSHAAFSEAGDGDDLEFRIHRLDDGRERWVAVRGRVFRNAEDAIVEVIGTARDITDHKLHDIHLHMLLREITHRSKNLLAIIQAMARQTVKDSLTAADFEQRLSLRLRGLAASHELLAAQDWHGAHMEELVKGQLGDVFDHYPGRVGISGPSLFVKPEAAQNIGLALNELATNAARFGALSNLEGRVEIAWAIDEGAGPERRLHITWRELGGPIVAPPRRQGFGHKVVERVAARALDGSVNLTFAPSGLQWSLHIPVSFVLSAQPTSLAGMPKYF